MLKRVERIRTLRLTTSTRRCLKLKVSPPSRSHFFALGLIYRLNFFFSLSCFSSSCLSVSLSRRFKALLQSHDPKELLGKEEYEVLAKKINEKKKRKERRKKGGDEDEEENDNKEEEEDKVDLEIAAEDKHRAQEKLISMKVRRVNIEWRSFFSGSRAHFGRFFLLSLFFFFISPWILFLFSFSFSLWHGLGFSISFL